MSTTMDGNAGADTKPEDTSLDDDLYDEAGQEDVKKQEQQLQLQLQLEEDDEYARAFDTPPAETEEVVDSDKLKRQDVSQAPESTQIAVATDTVVPVSIPHPSSIPLTETDHDGVAPKTDSGMQGPKPNSPKPEDSGAQIKPASPSHDENPSPNISEILAALNRRAISDQAGQASATNAGEPPASVAGPPSSQGTNNMLAHPTLSTDLPSKPPVQPPSIAAASPYHEMAPHVAKSDMLSPSGQGPASFFPPTHAAAPGTDSVAGYPVAAPPPLPRIPPTPSDHSQAQNSYFVGRTDGGANGSYHSLWQTFIEDEKRYSSEQNWERFPEGSRIFVGNLSSDKVSKRDVFNVFHRYGRLAQISLKSAFGFVQYHSAEEARAAIDNLQDHEIKGRKIHLEVSRSKTQNREAADRGGRGRGGKYDAGGQNNRRNRDGRDSRGGDVRGHGRDDSYSRDRPFYDSGRPRDRSMSPRAGGRDRHGSDQYRRRSPSPYGRSAYHDSSRYGSRTGSAEVLLLVLDTIDPQFISWVRESFDHHGLSTGVEHFRYDEDKKKYMARKAANEGIKAVVDLDKRAPVERTVVSYIFDSSRLHDIRYDEFPALPPETAAQVVLKQLQERGYRSSLPSYAPYGGGYPAAAQYPPAYPGQPQVPFQSPTYPHPPPSVYHPPGGGQGYGAPQNVGQQSHDVQDILSRLQHSAPSSAPTHLANSPPAMMPGTIPPPAHSPTGYGALPPHFLTQGALQAHQGPGASASQGYSAPPANVDPQTKQSVDSIMAQLARLRGP